LLEVLDDRVGTRSTLIASQLPVQARHTYVDDPTLADAILDRVVHSSHKIELKGWPLRDKAKSVSTPDHFSQAEARRFWDAMRTRFEQFSLELHGEKTRLLEFGRYAIERRQHTGQGKPQTFNFLGFTFICGRSRRGAFLIRRHTRRERMRAALGEIKDEMRRRRHDSLADQGRWLRSVVAGYFAYHAVPTNALALGAYRHHVLDLWRRSLQRRSQKDRTTWARMDRLAAEWLPPPHVLHPWPEERLAVSYLR
jgi:RNA-directed DNA polymerase